MDLENGCIVMNSTIDYYNKNAKEFCENTVDINMMSIYNRFLQYVPNKEQLLHPFVATISKILLYYTLILISNYFGECNL